MFNGLFWLTVPNYALGYNKNRPQYHLASDLQYSLINNKNRPSNRCSGAGYKGPAPA